MGEPDPLFDVGSLPRDPLRVLFSGCLLGQSCVWDGSVFAIQEFFAELMALGNVEATGFCPEDAVFGTPRDIPNCVGGNGFDVLEGRARVLMHSGADCTAQMVEGARRMVDFAVEHRADVAILLHISGACGTSVIYDGHRNERRYQRGPGVAAAALANADIPTLSQLDLRTLAALRRHVQPDWQPPAGIEWKDHREGEWFRATFGD